MTDAEENLIFERGEFGQQDPEVLQRTVWWLLLLHFGFRALDESGKLKWGDVKLQINGETGNEELVWTAERGSKCRNVVRDLEGHSAPQHKPATTHAVLSSFAKPLEAIVQQR